jgi:integrase
MRRTEATFADAAAEFLRYVESVRKREPSTVRDYRSVIDAYLLEEFGARRLETITADDIDAYKERLLAARTLSNRTIVRHLTVLHGIFRRAMRVWQLPTNPAAADLVERPPVRYSGEFELLTPDEVLALARAAHSQQDGAVYITAAFTGLRQGELLALRWRDVQWGLQRIHVRRNYTDRTEKAPKSGRVRSAPMVDEVMVALDALSRRDHFTRPDDLVFCSTTGDHLDSWALRRRFYAALERAGLRRVHFHDLRHCFASLAVKKLPLSTVQGYLGHAHISTTMRYVHHAPAAEDVAQLSAALRSETFTSPEAANVGRRAK